MKKLPEINCDLGEGMPNEKQIFPLIDTASMACGGHFGDGIQLEKSQFSFSIQEKSRCSPLLS